MLVLQNDPCREFVQFPPQNELFGFLTNITVDIILPRRIAGPLLDNPKSRDDYGSNVVRVEQPVCDKTGKYLVGEILHPCPRLRAARVFRAPVKSVNLTSNISS
jgi:hypothetical protein